MAYSRVASRYVKSLLSLAVDQGALEAIHNDMLLFDSTFKTNFDLVLMLRSPIVKHDVKKRILEKIFKGKVHNLTLAILDILTRKNREPILPEIASDFHQAYNEYLGIEKATILSAAPIDEKLRKEIKAIVKKLSLREEVELVETVDKEMIGGFVLNVGDRQIDASIKNKLKKLKVTFKRNPYIREL
ncbi:MAG: ATP synthase F1 subunit delta [Flammeovirgaceae bacterium]|nr:ATP synthase F1 subunit delta [Flammeovirgaceae bacterium]